MLELEVAEVKIKFLSSIKKQYLYITLKYESKIHSSELSFPLAKLFFRILARFHR